MTSCPRDQHVIVIECFFLLVVSRLHCVPYHCIMDVDFSAALRSLTMTEIEDAVPPRTFRMAEKRSRAKLEDAAHLLPVHDRASLADAAMFKRRRTEEHTRERLGPDSPFHSPRDSLFFETVSEGRRRECISHFIDATGSQALRTASCAVCAGSFFATDLEQVSLAFLQQKNRLTPSKPHPSQVLTEGMLLHRGPHSFDPHPGTDSHANICSSCASLLRNNRTPVLALANGMWIGDVPLVLWVLTLPEWIL